MGCEKCGGNEQQYCKHCEEEFFQLNDIDPEVEALRASILNLNCSDSLIIVLEQMLDLIKEK